MLSAGAVAAGSRHDGADIFRERLGITASEMAHRKFASAPKLVVEMLLADDFAAPVLQAALFPVHVPIADAAREKCGFFGCFPNLLEPLPAAPCERRCEAFNAEGFRCERRCAHARLEADEASCAAFGFVLKPPDGFAPALMLIVAVDEGHAERFAVADALAAADVVLFAREDVGVVEKDGRAIAPREQPFKNGARAWRAAAVQQNGRRLERRIGVGGGRCAGLGGADRETVGRRDKSVAGLRLHERKRR